MPNATAPARFAAKVREDENGCLRWQGYIDRDGYGKFWDGEKITYAHRVAHELFIGPIPDGYEVDHLCRVRDCVQWRHLEAVPPQVNNARSTSPTAMKLRNTTCPQGHEFTPENTYLDPRNGRQCRECRRAADRRRTPRRRAS
jgi:hypothetical protein